MDADSSYGGSDTAQDYHSAHENNSSFETSHTDSSHNHDQDRVTEPVLITQSPPEEINNQFYHRNEVTLPINYNENGYQIEESLSQPKEPHYLSTANLNINETLEHHSNLEEMSKHYKSTSHLNSDSPTDLRKLNLGIDNMVFEDDVPDQMNVKSTFDNTKPYNGELHPTLVLGINSPNHNEEPMTEAVNLELINLKPVGKDVTGPYENIGNGMTTIPLKRENDTEVGNPYDEYFVPVNEHRKYMRGKKLYVTMDKRGKKSKSKCLCWAVCLFIVAAALIIGILAAVGVIGNQGSLPEVSARNFDGTEPQIKKGGIFTSSKVSNTEPPNPFTPEPSISTVSIMPSSTEKSIFQVDVTEKQESLDDLSARKLSETEPEVKDGSLFTSPYMWNTEPFTPAPSISTVSNMLPSTEMSMIQVPRALESQFLIDNVQFIPELAKTNSSEFNALAMVIGKEIKEFLFSKDVLQYGPADIKVKVMELTPEEAGHVAIKYRIIWKFKYGIHNPKDPIDKVVLEKKMSQLLEQNGGLVGPYHVSETTVTAERILDLCKIENNGCEHICLFDYDILDFTCICPEGKKLAMNKKNCIDEPKYRNFDFINNYDDMQNDYFKSNSNFDTVMTTQPSVFADSEIKNSSNYTIYSIPYSDISSQTEITTEPELVDVSKFREIAQDVYNPSTSTKQNFVQDTDKYVTESVSDLLNETTDSFTNSNLKPEKSENEKISEYSNLPTEYSVQHENLSDTDTTIIKSNKEHITTYPFETTTDIYNMDEKQILTTVQSTEPPTGKQIERNTELTLQALAETTTELLSEHTSEPTTEPNVETISIYSENLQRKLIEDKQNYVTEKMFIQTTTRAIEKDIANGDNEIYTTPKITTPPDIISEDKMNEIGLVKVVTPEAEIYTTTIGPASEHIYTNRNYKTLKEKSETIQPFNYSDNEMLGKSQMTTLETTTQLILSQTGENELRFIPVVINEDEEINRTENVSKASNISTKSLSLNPLTVPINKNEHYETNNQNPNVYEVTTQQAISEIKQNNESSTELLSEQMHVVEHPENSPADYMSPFLPEIENDTTFANTLHSDDHFSDSIFISKDSHENITELNTTPPNLENDQINHTNPLDLQQNDTSLGVVPLEQENKDILSSKTENPSKAHDDENENTLQANNHDDTTEDNLETTAEKEPLIIAPLTENNLESTTVSTELDNNILIAKENGTDPEREFITSTTLEPLETTSLGSELEEITTDITKKKDMISVLPLEIINNVHSNSYFENNTNISEQSIIKNDKINKEEDVATQTPTEITTTENSLTMDTETPELITENENNIITSTEDLIVSETTTNGFKINDGNQTQEINSEANYLFENSMINGEIVEVTTELVNTETTETNNISTEQFTTSVSQSTPSLPVLYTSEPINHYEVKENVADITTTEKLFLSVKPTTKIITNQDNEDLSIIPLEKEIVDNTKLDIKRLANAESFNQLELLDNNNFNSISTEDQNLNAFPEEFNNNHVDDLLQEKNITHPDYTNNSSTGIENGKQKYDKYNKAIFNKTLKQDLLVLKGDKEKLNTLKQGEKVKINHFDTVKPVTEDFILPRFTRCVVDQFPCLNGTYIKDGSYCIPGNDRCDSVYDCSDGSDEVNCIEEGCPNNFQCSSGQCLKRYLVCDGIINCNDGSDEENCDKWTCNFDELSCGSGYRCIPISWKCDGRSQCNDGSDEHHCHQYTCSNDAFHCTEQDTCIPLSWKCDGKNDCANGDDEKFCACTKEQFKCQMGGGCLDMEEVCDGIEQCADKSDEWNCLRLEELSNNSEENIHKNILQVQYKNNTWYPVCMDWSNWNTTYADKVCQNMGFAGATLLESVPKIEGFQADGYYKLINPSRPMYELSILSQLEKTEHNDCDQLVSITCKEFACGSTGSIDTSSDQMTGGNETVPTQWPSLGLLYDKKHNMYCTVTILTPLWAIASYSCMIAVTRSIDTSEWTLTAGSTNFFYQVDNSTAQTRQIKQVIPHPQAKFSRFGFINDVILIQLSQPLILNKNVSTVCLPNKQALPNQICVMTGWGVTKPGEPSKRQYIHYLSSPIINSEECNSTKHYNGMITEDKICAGYKESENECYSDEGAPLMCFSNASESWELQGILSHPENCGSSPHPATYSSIDLKLRSWITNTIGKEAFIRNL